MQKQRWYPTRQQLKGDSVQQPESKLELAFRQVLIKHYNLEDRVSRMGGPSGNPSNGSPNGPMNSKLVGLNILPIDVATLADGSALVFVKASGDLEFKPGGGGGGVTSLNALTGALVIAAGAGITVTPSGSTITIAATGGAVPNFADDETPAGSRPGTAFTLAHTPNPAASLELFWNGVLQKPGGFDYTLAGNAITMVNTVGTGDPFLAWYRY
jgi:hypothetical protein